MLEAMDTEIGRCVASLRSISPETTIIFIGDNGTAGIAANPDENPLRLKGTVYQGGVHIPLFIHGPRVQQPGRDVQQLVHAVDLFATIAELAGAPLPGDIDSTSLIPYLVDPLAPPQRIYLFAETSIDPFPCDSARVGCQRAIRGERFKLIQNVGSRTDNDRDGPADFELYDLIQDPRETNNLLVGIEFPEYEATFQDLWNQLQEYYPLAEPIPDWRPFEGGRKQ
jgi:arylsulfatase A-like enzyme